MIKRALLPASLHASGDKAKHQLLLLQSTQPNQLEETKLNQLEETKLNQFIQSIQFNH